MGDEMAIALVPIEHIHEELVSTEFGKITQLQFPEPSSEAKHFQMLRRLLNIDLHDAATALEVNLDDVLDLEYGRQRASDWSEAEQALMKWKLKKD